MSLFQSIVGEKKLATIKDIALKAGVSISTASRALNDNPRISKTTRTKVKKVAEQMGYQPNYNAQNLTRGKSNMVGLVFPVTGKTAPANPFHIDLMRGISSALKPLHYEMVVAIAPNLTELLESVKSMAEQSKVHNFLVFYTMKNDPVTAYLRANKLNFVVIGHPIENANDRYVDNDNIAAGEAATEHLIDVCHVHQPAFLYSGQGWMYELDRATGYKKCMQRHHAPSLVWSEHGDHSIGEYLEKHPEVDSLVCSDDLLFGRLNRQLQKYNLPITCFNNSRLMGMLLEESERVDLQPRVLGREAVNLLFRPREHYRLVDFKIYS